MREKTKSKLVSVLHFISNFHVKLKSGIGSCIAPKAGLARHPAKGRCRAGISRFYSFGILVSVCPGPGSSWGNLAVPPASKEAVGG